jgi:hypothetical protein
MTIGIDWYMDKVSEQVSSQMSNAYDITQRIADLVDSTYRYSCSKNEPEEITGEQRVREIWPEYVRSK